MDEQERESLIDTIGRLEIDEALFGDNLAILLATHFHNHPDRPQPDPVDEETGWGAWVRTESDRALGMIADLIEERESDLRAALAAATEELAKYRSAPREVADQSFWRSMEESLRKVARGDTDDAQIAEDAADCLAELVVLARTACRERAAATERAEAAESAHRAVVGDFQFALRQRTHGLQCERDAAIARADALAARLAEVDGEHPA